MFRRYMAKSTTASGNANIELAGVTYQLATLSPASGSQEAVTTTMQVYGGNTGGDAVIVLSDTAAGTIAEDAIRGLYKLSVSAQATVTIDIRELIPSGCNIHFGSQTEGLMLCVACDVSEVM